MLHKLPKLSYAYKDLEPFIDRETVRIHYSKHHAGYVNKLNNTLKGNKKLLKLELDDLMKKYKDIDKSIRQSVVNFAGGHINHNLYWNNIAPYNKDSLPGVKLSDALKSSFGSIESFIDLFKQKAMGVFGSGWAFLIINKKGRLEITRQSFQNSPLMYGQIPLLTIDVWEHAYYLKYKNRRIDYVNAFVKLINWKSVEKRFLKAMK